MDYWIINLGTYSMIRERDINPKFEKEVEFLNLSNLSLSCPRAKSHIAGFNKPGLYPLGDEEVDKCYIDYPPTVKDLPNDCEADENCFRYYDQGLFACALKERKFNFSQIPEFPHRNVIHEVQHYKQLWCEEKDSSEVNLFFSSSNERKLPIMMYYRIIYSLRTKIVYVSFSSGVVFLGPDVVENLKEYSLSVIEKIKEMVEPDIQICLCGHSMGATLSMAVAYHWFKSDLPENRVRFENVTVVALGALNIFDPDTNFKHLPNIRSYLSAEATSSKTFIDPFCSRGDRTKYMYSPVKLILPTEDEIDVTDIVFNGNNAVINGMFHINQHYTDLHGLTTKYVPKLLDMARKKGGSRKKTKRFKRFKSKTKKWIIRA